MLVSEPAVDDFVAGSTAPLVAAAFDGVRVLIFNRPEVRNALSLKVRKDFARLTEEASADPAVKVVLVTGASGQFSAGVDLKEYRSGPPRPMFRPHPGEAARSMKKPMIAAVDGSCVTGALEIALSCSFIIASTRARFADTHAKLGLFPGWGLSALLPRAIGVRRARQMSLTGEFIGAEKALQWGLVNEVTPPELLLPRCFELARALQACDERSVAWQLDLMARCEGAPLDVALDAEVETHERWRAERDAEYERAEWPS